mmetsp:Transcript_7122/g.13149  ORF Transcript_7122/g.13149 Transcript_7122/m.13149 type:complete len:265 (+) Transcript_7122:377-1171(+)
MIDLGTLSVTFCLTMLKYDAIRDLMISVSISSLSEGFGALLLLPPKPSEDASPLTAAPMVVPPLPFFFLSLARRVPRSTWEFGSRFFSSMRSRWTFLLKLWMALLPPTKSGWLVLTYDSSIAMRSEIICLVGLTCACKSSWTQSSSWSRSFGNLRSCGTRCSHWDATFCSSSNTMSTHCKLGPSSLFICFLTSSSKDTSGTNSEGLGPVALRIAVRMSRSVRRSNGCMFKSPLAKTWWNTYEILAPPYSSPRDTSGDRPPRALM